MHGLEQKTALDGTTYTAFAAYKKPGWHALGQVFTEPATATEILEMAGMHGWNVRLQPMRHFIGMIENNSIQQLQIEGDITDESIVALAENMPTEVPYFIEMAGQYVIVRNEPFTGKPEILGTAKTKYTPVQNEELFALGDAIIDFEGNQGASWETAGSIKDGRVVFGTIKLPESLTIGNEDLIDEYLMVTAGHDGNMPIIAQTTGIRVVCANTWNMAMGSFKNRITFKHTASAIANLDAAKRSLAQSHAYYKALGAVGNALIAIPMNTDGFVKVLDHHWKKPKPDVFVESALGLGDQKPREIVRNQKSITQWSNKRDAMVAVWEQKTDRGETLGEAAGTAWGAVNAITESLDWHGSETGGLLRAAGFNDTNNELKSNVLEYVAKRATVDIKEHIAVALKT